MAERIPTQSHIYTVLKRKNCPIYTHTHTRFLSPGVLEHIRVCLKPFLDHGECGLGVLCWWKTFGVRCGLQGSGRAGCSSIVLLTSRGTCCHSTPTPPNPLRLALLEGVDPSCQLHPDWWSQETIPCPVNTVSAFFFLLFILLLRSLTFLQGDLDSMNRVDRVKELWEYPTVAEKRCGQGRCESWPALMTLVLVQGIQMKRSLDYFWTSAEMWAVHILRWKYGLFLSGHL